MSEGAVLGDVGAAGTSARAGILGVRWKSGQTGIYIGRRFRNDTERLEKLFEMYTKMTAKGAGAKKAAKKAGGRMGKVKEKL